mgnify:CR=1 FL=1
MARPKGSMNFKTDYLFEIARKRGVDPFNILLRFAAGDWKGLGYKEEKTTKFIGENSYEEYTISPELRMSAASKACEYLYPKRKAIEHSIEQETITGITRTILTKKV